MRVPLNLNTTNVTQHRLLESQAIRRHPIGHTLVCLLLGGFVMASPILASLALLLFGDTRLGSALMFGGSKVTPLLVLLSAMFFVAFPPILLGVLFRQLWIKAMTRKFVRELPCACGYSLLGLQVIDGAVDCPECGQHIMLAERGLTPENLLVPMNDRLVS